MATRMGPATIAVQLDVRGALAQLNALDQQLRKLQGTESLVGRSMENSAAMAAKTAQEATRNLNRAAASAQAAERSVTSALGVRPGGSRISRLLGSMAKLYSIAKAFEVGASAGGEFYREFTKGTPFEGYGSDVAKILQKESDVASDVLNAVKTPMRALNAVSTLQEQAALASLAGADPDLAKIGRIMLAQMEWQRAQDRLGMQRAKIDNEALGRALGKLGNRGIEMLGKWLGGGR